MTTTYQVFGLRLRSYFPIPPLEQADPAGTTDVTIRYAELPEQLPGATVISEQIQVAGDRLLLHIPKVARFQIRAGAEIQVDLLREDRRDRMLLYLLGTAMGVVLFQRGLLPLHGSAVLLREQALLFLGESGNGKSTLAAALGREGLPFLSDDIAAIHDAPTRLHSGYPQRKLCADSFAHLLGNESVSHRMIPEADKHAVSHPEFFRSGAFPLRTIYEIVPTEAAVARLEEVRGAECLRVLMANTYRPFLPHALSCREAHVDACHRLAGEQPILRLHLPRGLNHLTETMDLMLKDR